MSNEPDEANLENKTHISHHATSRTERNGSEPGRTACEDTQRNEFATSLPPSLHLAFVEDVRKPFLPATTRVAQKLSAACSCCDYLQIPGDFQEPALL
jgi:hypothetical protein